MSSKKIINSFINNGGYMLRTTKFSVIAACFALLGLLSCGEDTASPKIDDKTPPKLTITKPLNNQEFDVGANIEIVADASDAESGIGSVNFYIDGKYIFADDIPPFALNWDTKGEKSGIHKIKVIAMDNEKLVSTTEIAIMLKENFGYTEVFAEGLKGATGLVLSDDGNFFVSNSGDKTIVKINSDAGKTHFTDIDCPELNGLMMNKDNTLLAACGNKVIKIDMNGNKTIFAEGFKKAYSCTADNYGNVYILDALDNKIIKITGNGTKSDFISGIAFNYTKDKLLITNLVFDKDYKYLYVSAVIDNKIYKYPINSDGTAGKSQLVASLQGPNYLAIDKDNNIFATTFYDAALIKIQDGKPVTIAKGMFSSPSGMVFGNEKMGGNSIFIADKAQNKIFRVYVGTTAII
jgi:sugar lactone lactonase YvrE